MQIDEKQGCYICYDAYAKGPPHSKPKFYVSHPKNSSNAIIHEAKTLKKDNKLHLICAPCFQILGQHPLLKCPQCHVHFSEIETTLKRLELSMGRPPPSAEIQVLKRHENIAEKMGQEIYSPYLAKKKELETATERFLLNGKTLLNIQEQNPYEYPSDRAWTVCGVQVSTALKVACMTVVITSLFAKYSVT